MSRGGAAAAEGEGRALHRGAGAAAAGALRRVLGPGVGRLLRAHRVHHQGVIHLQGKDYIALHSRVANPAVFSQIRGQSLKSLNTLSASNCAPFK